MPKGKVIVDRRDGGVVFVVLNNPKRRNAIDVAMQGTLLKAFDELEQDEDIKVIVLTGSGDHFCAGADIKGWQGGFGPAMARKRIWGIQTPVRKILSMEKPVFAMVRGYAVGAAMNIALACDLIFASDDARFSQPFVRLGMIPDAGGLCFLPLAVGLHKAKELMFSAEMVDAQEAFRLGFVNRVFTKEKLESETLAFAQKIAGGPSFAVGMIKRILNTTFLSTFECIMEYEAQGQPLCLQTKDHQEGKTAFIEKRSPRFTEE